MEEFKLNVSGRWVGLVSSQKDKCRVCDVWIDNDPYKFENVCKACYEEETRYIIKKDQDSQFRGFLWHEE